MISELAIVARLQADRCVSDSQIVRDLGVPRSHVQAARRKHGLTKISTTAITVLGRDVARHEGLYTWLRETCPMGADLSAYITSILADAMHEERDENEGNALDLPAVASEPAPYD